MSFIQALVLQHPFWGADPGVSRDILPQHQLFLQQSQRLGILGVVGQVDHLCGVLGQVVHLPLGAIVVLLQGLVPRQLLSPLSAVQNVLEAEREVEVLVDGEGHPEVEVVDELEAASPDHSHRVVHGDLVEVVAGEDG